jgi:hypothetical protein
MKYAVDHAKTRQSLDRWAGTLKLCRASYFLWNQGFEMQKSLVGFLQSLLYQILRQMPDLVSQIDPSHLDHELWEYSELRAVFDKVMVETAATVRFCFFIDGLDEYNGDEEDIADLIRVISRRPHVKICASSRPRTIFERRLWTDGNVLTMQDFTRNDMQDYVRRTLRKSSEFRALEAMDPSCTDLINQIALEANSVWLWVDLVTRDIVRAANRLEGPRKLHEIVNGFPRRLEKYFAHIICRIAPEYREEMAKTFLTTIFEVQPLPLYAIQITP